MERLLSPQELAKLTGLKVSYLYHLTHYKRIPFLKLGSTVKFKISEVEKWLAGCEVSHAVSAKATRQKKNQPGLNRKKILSVNKQYLNRLEQSARKEVLG